jgi:hypothetical protein
MNSAETERLIFHMEQTYKHVTQTQMRYCHKFCLSSINFFLITEDLKIAEIFSTSPRKMVSRLRPRMLIYLEFLLFKRKFRMNQTSTERETFRPHPRTSRAAYKFLWNGNSASDFELPRIGVSGLLTTPVKGKGTRRVRLMGS